MTVKIKLTEGQARDLVALLEFWNSDGDVLCDYYENAIGGLPLALCGGVTFQIQRQKIQAGIDAAKNEPVNIGAWIDQDT